MRDRPGRSPRTCRALIRGQLAALGALVLAAAFLVGLLFLIADDPIGFPLAFVSVFTIAFFGWLFVAGRGPRRLLGLPAVLLGLVVLVMWAYDHKVALPVLIGVLALFGLAARYAVRHSRAPMEIARRHPRPAGPCAKEACSSSIPTPAVGRANASI